jgi:transcriptional regulator with XRE-family HTH domain
MEERELRALLANNIKKYRSKRGWSQLILSEKINISANFLSEIETGKGWVSPLTLVKLASVLEVEVYELFKPINTIEDKVESENIKRFAKDLSLALDISVAENIKNAKNTIEKVCKEYLE